MDKLAWLHLSDIHFLPTNAWQDGTAHDALLETLATQLSQRKIRVDLIFCTGDIAFGELPKQPLDEQYAMARKFFDKVLAVCQCDKDRLFIVPGNHDIDRNCFNKGQKESWVNWGEDARAPAMRDEIGGWFAGLKQDAKDAMRRLDVWGKFVADYLPHQQHACAGHYHHAQILEIRGRKIGIAGFNSAWTCAGPEDERRLWLAAGPQFDHMRTTLKTAALKIGLIHHPWDWFNLAERQTIRQRIGDEAHFWLHGHSHESWVEPLPTHVTLGAGALGAKAEAEFGCNLVQLDFASGQGCAYLYRYEKGRARWISANVDPKGVGVWPFALPDALQGQGIGQEDQEDQEDQPEQDAGATQAPDNAPATEDKRPEPPDTSPADLARIEQTRKALAAYLHQEHFDDGAKPHFAENGMPCALDQVFRQVMAQSGRAALAKQCLDAINAFAGELLACVAKTAPGPAVPSAERKAEWRARLINAMQQAILLSAKQDALQSARMPGAYGGSAFAGLDVAQLVSVSVLYREKLAEHVDATFPPGRMAQFHDTHHLDLFGGVEKGTNERLENHEKSNRPGAESAVRKVVWNNLFPGEPKFVESDINIDLLQGELAHKKDVGEHLLVIAEPRDGQLSPGFVRWLNHDMHLGLVSITSKQGVFELSEGTWRAKLAALYKTLQPFEQNC